MTVWSMAVMVAVAIFLGSAPAHASTLTCQLSTGGWFDPPMRGLASTTGSTSGSFSATTGGLVNRHTCDFVFHDRRWDVTFATTGTFVSESCGTALLTGGPNATSTTIRLVTGNITVDLQDIAYTIELRGWQGLLRVTKVDGRAEDGGDDVDGVLTFVPDQACVDRNVINFTADGGFSVSW